MCAYIVPLLCRPPACSPQSCGGSCCRAVRLLINRRNIWNHYSQLRLPKFGYNVLEAVSSMSRLLMPAHLFVDLSSRPGPRFPCADYRCTQERSLELAPCCPSYKAVSPRVVRIMLILNIPNQPHAAQTSRCAGPELSSVWHASLSGVMLDILRPFFFFIICAIFVAASPLPGAGCRIPPR